MRITRPGINKILRTYEKQEKINKPEKTKETTDNIKLSQQAKLFNKAMQKLTEMPEIRQEKVDHIKQQLQQGTYNVDKQEVAQKMLEHFTIDREL